MFAFGPYTPLASAQTLMSLKELPRALAATRIDQRDDINVLVFLKQGKVEQVVPFSREQVEIPARQPGPFTPDNAMLERNSSTGRLVLAAPDKRGPPP